MSIGRLQGIRAQVDQQVTGRLRIDSALLLNGALAAMIAAFYAVFIERTSFQFNGDKFYTLFDDAMISMRYARNLADGHGFAWNPGETPVEGFTNPLWTLWMALMHLVDVPEASISLLVALSSVPILLGSALVMRAIASRLYGPNRTFGPLVFWATVAYYPLVFWSLRGMEVGLITLLLSLSLLMALRLRDAYSNGDLVGLCLVFSLGLLTRMEFLIAAGIISGFAFYWCQGNRSSVGFALLIAMGATIAALTAFRLIYFGELLPNTYYLKVEGIPFDTKLARGVATLIFVNVTHLLGVLLLVGLYLVQRRFRPSASETLILAVVASAFAYSLWVGGDAWDDYAFANRYLAPVVPLMLILSLKALENLSTSRSSIVAAAITLLAAAAVLNWLLATPRGTPGELRTVACLAMAAAMVLAYSRRFAVPAIVPALMVVVALNLAPLGGWLRDGAPHSDGDAAWSAFGLLLRETTTPETTIAVTWAGAVSYFSHRDTFDELGKTDAQIAKGPSVAKDFRPGHSKWNLAHTLSDLRPDLVSSFYFVSAEDAGRLAGWGYVQLINACFIRADSSNIDIAALQTGFARLETMRRFEGYTCSNQDAGSFDLAVLDSPGR